MHGACRAASLDGLPIQAFMAARGLEKCLKTDFFGSNEREAFRTQDVWSAIEPRHLPSAVSMVVSRKLCS